MTAVTLRTPITVGTNENLDATFHFWQDTAKTIPTNLAGYTATFGMRSVNRKEGRDLGASAAVLLPNTIHVNIAPELLDELVAGNYAFEVAIIAADGHRTTKLRGTVSLKEGIAP